MPVKYMMTDSAYLHYYRLGFILQRLVFKETGQVKEKGHQDLIKLFTPGHRRGISISAWSYNVQQCNICLHIPYFNTAKKQNGMGSE